jgi:hypothetical protein
MTVSIGPLPEVGRDRLVERRNVENLQRPVGPGRHQRSTREGTPPRMSGTIKVPPGTRARPPRAAHRAARPRSDRASRRIPRGPPCRAPARWLEPAGVGATARAFSTGGAGVQASYSTPTKSLPLMWRRGSQTRLPPIPQKRARAVDRMTLTFANATSSSAWSSITVRSPFGVRARHTCVGTTLLAEIALRGCERAHTERTGRTPAAQTTRKSTND